MRLPFADAVRTVDARVDGALRAPAFLHVVTDTRSLLRGDTFLALRGERYDGHRFLGEAVARGAAAVIVERAAPIVDGIVSLVVEDALVAYMQLAGLARSLFRGRVLGITGSSGKTTTKTFVVQLLQLRYGDRVLAAPANENNQIGVSKVLHAATNEDHDVLVVEMGARHYGDIAELVAIARPDLGILTNVGDAHLEIMGSRERLAETKWSLFGGGARAILNADDEVSRSRVSALSAPPHWFYAGRDGESVTQLGRVTALLGEVLLDASAGQERRARANVHVPGAHNRSDAAAAIAAALDLDVPFDAIPGALAALRLPPGRYERAPLASGAVAIFDAYNANAASMLAALDAFAGEPAERRIAVLAGMAELGDDAAALHERVGARAAHASHVLLAGGEFAQELMQGARDAGLPAERIVAFATNAQASSWLREHAGPGDVVLLKGSRKYALEEVLQELTA